MEEEEEAGKGCWRRRLGWGSRCAWVGPEPDAGTDVLAWPGWGWGDPDPKDAGSSELCPLSAVGHCPKDLLLLCPPPLYYSYEPLPLSLPQLWPSHLWQCPP